MTQPCDQCPWHTISWAYKNQRGRLKVEGKAIRLYEAAPQALNVSGHHLQARQEGGTKAAYHEVVNSRMEARAAALLTELTATEATQ